MNRRLLMTSLALLGLAAGVSHAKDGLIVKGNNGTKWCCPGGKISDGCEKGASSTPVGAHCNFAARAYVAPKSTVQPRAAEASSALTGPATPLVQATQPMPNPPAERKWASPPERCRSQDGTKDGWVSVGEGGRRCEYFIARPRSSEPSARD